MIYVTNAQNRTDPIPWGATPGGYQTFRPGPRRVEVTLVLESTEDLADLMHLADREQWRGVEVLEGLR